MQTTYGFVNLNSIIKKKRNNIKDKIKESINSFFNKYIRYLLQIDDLNKIYQLDKTIDISFVTNIIENDINNKECSFITLNPIELKTYNDIISIIKQTNKIVNKSTNYNEQLKILKDKIIKSLTTKCNTINKLNKKLYYKNYKTQLEKNKKLINRWKKKYSIVEAFKYGGLSQYIVLSMLAASL